MIITEETANKFDGQKVMLELIPPNVLMEFGQVLTYGAKKYGANNWKAGKNGGLEYTRVAAGIMRHLMLLMMGQDRDKETGLLHSAHIMCGAMFLTHYLQMGTGVDDRDYIPEKYIERICSTNFPSEGVEGT